MRLRELTSNIRSGEFVYEASDPRVVAMQTAMQKAGAKNTDGTPLTIDGQMGPNTQAAMSNPQFAQYIPRNLNLAQQQPAASTQQTPQRPQMPHTPTPQEPAQAPAANVDTMGNQTGAVEPAPAGQAVVHKDGSIVIGNHKRTGGSLNWRANNPGNNMMSDLAKQYGAIGTIIAGDKVPTAIMPSLDAGIRLQMAQWRSPKYNELTIDAGCQQWATGVKKQGYGSVYARDLARAAGATIDTKVKDLTNDQLYKMCMKQGKWEGSNPNVQVVALNTNPAQPAA